MKGFTLIELLVVIAIVGLIGGVIVDGIKTSKLPESDQCKAYESYSQKDIPAKCIKYFK